MRSHYDQGFAVPGLVQAAFGVADQDTVLGPGRKKRKPFTYA